MAPISAYINCYLQLVDNYCFDRCRVANHGSNMVAIFLKRKQDSRNITALELYLLCIAGLATIQLVEDELPSSVVMVRAIEIASIVDEHMAVRAEALLSCKLAMSSCTCTAEESAAASTAPASIEQSEPLSTACVHTMRRERVWHRHRFSRHCPLIQSAILIAGQHHLACGRDRGDQRSILQCSTLASTCDSSVRA